VREATLADEPRLRELYDVVDRFHVEALPGLFRPADDPGAVRDIAGLIEDPDTLLLVAQVGNGVVGFVGAKLVEVGPDNPVFMPRRFVYVDDMAVLPESRRQGVGRALLDAVEAWARGRGIDRIELTVFEFNGGARRLYEGAGFETVLRRMGKDV
jgi:ribosomal protein S18 acetylase RimI-like enzyme